MIASKAQETSRMVFWNSVPNAITTIRIMMLFAVVFFLYTNLESWKAVAIGFLVTMLLMDKLDGYLARKLDQATKFGSVFDIAGDRIIEVVLWIVFAHLQLIPVWVPIVILTRGILTDSIRHHALSKGKTPFGKESMMRSRLSEFIVGSDLMRAVACVKIPTFVLLILSTTYPELLGVSLILTYVSVFVNLVRGIPVIMDARA